MVTTTLLDSYVAVALFKRLAIFLDLNGVAIENPHGDVFAAKFHRSIRRRNPTLESGIRAFIIHDDFDVGSLEWPNSDKVLSG